MGRAIITTDARGCKETVINGKNGFKVPVKNFQLAASSMLELIDKDLRKKMGANSRLYCEQKFDVHKVNNIILKEINSLE